MPTERTGRATGGNLRLFGVAHTVAICCLILAFLIGGTQGLAIVALLGLLEVAVSFDNAIVNATVLARMGPFWQRMFYTVGILVAAIGMRLLVPLAIVSVGARLDPLSALRMAYRDPEQYHRLLSGAQPAIASFGGAFLMMIFLNFVFEDRDDTWIPWVEKPLRRLGRLPRIGEMCLLGFAIVAAATVPSHIAFKVMAGSVTGLLSYMLVDSAGQVIAHEADADGASRPRATVAGRAAFFLFCYLELLDATFSFDSVMGAFSVTLNLSLITIGLAIGAAYIRALTVFVVRKGTLEQYRYLEHGAYYAIGMLALLLMVEVWHDVPDVLTAGAGGLLIVAAVACSLWSRRRQERAILEADVRRPVADVHMVGGARSVAGDDRGSRHDNSAA
jgi:uncharacterized protein